jgi:triosephosphate isomerase
MRRKIVAGNWKMNNNLEQSKLLTYEIVKQLDNLKTDAIAVLIPSFVVLQQVSKTISSSKNVFLGAQNVHPKPSGAYTGEISVEMLQSVNVQFVLVGHSERREYFCESEDFLKQKVDAVIAAGLTPIFCCGESLTIRQEQTQENFVKTQLQKSLFHLSIEQIENCVIAYEQIWAIGTGLTATAEQAQQMHFFIRKIIAEKYNQTVANSISILYGGSCNPTNAKSIFSQPDVDGGLIGGASLKANDFIQIIKSI